MTTIEINFYFIGSFYIVCHQQKSDTLITTYCEFVFFISFRNAVHLLMAVVKKIVRKCSGNQFAWMQALVCLLRYHHFEMTMDNPLDMCMFSSVYKTSKNVRSRKKKQEIGKNKILFANESRKKVCQKLRKWKLGWSSRVLHAHFFTISFYWIIWWKFRREKHKQTLFTFTAQPSAVLTER